MYSNIFSLLGVVIIDASTSPASEDKLLQLPHGKYVFYLGLKMLKLEDPCACPNVRSIILDTLLLAWRHFRTIFVVVV